MATGFFIACLIDGEIDGCGAAGLLTVKTHARTKSKQAGADAHWCPVPGQGAADPRPAHLQGPRRPSGDQCSCQKEPIYKLALKVGCPVGQDSFPRYKVG